MKVATTDAERQYLRQWKKQRRDDKADPVRQAAFLAKQLRPLLAQAEAGQAVGYFADAAHPTHNTRST